VWAQVPHLFPFPSILCRQWHLFLLLFLRAKKSLLASFQSFLQDAGDLFFSSATVNREIADKMNTGDC
jgi:hypothetical protein